MILVEVRLRRNELKLAPLHGLNRPTVVEPEIRQRRTPLARDIVMLSTAASFLRGKESRLGGNGRYVSNVPTYRPVRQSVSLLNLAPTCALLAK